MCRLHRMPGVSKPNYPIQHFFEESSNGRTAGFDPAYRGSNPCSSAIFGQVGEWLNPIDCKSITQWVTLVRI